MSSEKLYNGYTPYVTEYTSKGERVSDLASRLFRDRIIILNGEINSDTATMICAQILVLQYENDKEPIQIFINSPGGEVNAGFAIYDMMQNSPCTIRTVCIGQACSFAAVILAAGTKGHRSILKNSRVLLHQPWGGMKGQVTDIGIHFDDMQKMKERITDVLAHHCNQNRTELSKQIERDFILYADEAVKYGIVDEVLQKHQK